MASLNHPAVGAPKPSPAPADNSVPLRLELRALQKNADQWNLYLLGLADLKSIDPKSDLSYYGIAGIHGRPYRAWGGVKGSNSGQWQGYCTHTSILFAPWHRPYLAVFEQALYASVQKVAAQFPAETRARYQKVASTFRVPYWDWAAEAPAGDTNFPRAVGSPNISVVTPQSNGQSVQIPNPLYSHKFNPLNPINGDFFTSWQNTLRHPTSTRATNATSNDRQVFAAVASQFTSLQGNVNILLNDPNYKDFDAFSNHAWQDGQPGSFASIEDIHNSIHGDIGGPTGHMSRLEYSSFDPVFWLHHTNVDRLFAIWQVLNPSSYTIDKPSQSGTFVRARRAKETKDTPLAPFVNSTGAMWTSTAVQNTETFNYAYPETQRWAFGTDAEYQANVQKTVQRLYGGISNQFMAMAAASGLPAATPPPAAPSAPAPVISEGIDKTKAANGSAAAGADPPPAEKPAEHHPSNPLGDFVENMKQHIMGSSEPRDGVRGLDLESEIGQPSATPAGPQRASSFTEYIANLKAPKHILNQGFRVYVFLGDFTPSTDTWCTQDASIGTLTVFGSNPETTGCGKCQADAEDDVVVTGTVPLTAALLQQYQAGNLGGLSKENVLPWLRRNLHWRVTLDDGTEKSRGEVPGLNLSVVSTEVELPVGGLPRYSGVYEVHPEVTDGRPAGMDNGEAV
ncbi:tyrosinase precursor [Amylocarpus encephaloides]|uniref:tyrosinase n=1 Tax=Amylocarpus encephaloides TaxID=45428 RepID=A0A9P7YSQ7_9HELO|nr:tyrosinase precursor [Amylocarpus encephaloides]